MSSSRQSAWRPAAAVGELSPPASQREPIVRSGPSSPSPQEAARRLPAPASVGALSLCVAAAAFLAFSAASGRKFVDTASAPEPRSVAGPLAGLAPPLTNAGFAVALTILTLGYLVVLVWSRGLTQRALWAAIISAHALFLLGPLLLSSDVFGYIAYARLGVLHHLNPYLSAPLAAPHDSVLPLVYWQHQTSPYGPLFTTASYATGGLGLAGALWTFKALAALSSLGAAAIVSRVAARIGRDPLRAAALIGLNPLVLVYAVGGGHNDPLVMLLSAASLLLLTTRRTEWGVVALVAAAATKVSAGVLLPFVLLGAPSRARAAATMVAAASAVVAGTLALFGTHLLDTVASIVTQQQFANDDSGPALVGQLLGTGLTSAVRASALGVLVAVLGWQLWRTSRGADWVVGAGWTTVAALLCIPSSAPWYICWLLPLTAIGKSRRLLTVTLVLTTVIVLLYLPLFGRAPKP